MVVELMIYCHHDNDAVDDVRIVLCHTITILILKVIVNLSNVIGIYTKMPTLCICKLNPLRHFASSTVSHLL